MNVLLVDDDSMVRAVCTNMLQAMKHDVKVAASGSDAIKLLCSTDSVFDIMLLDDAMPEMDGLATLRQLEDLGIGLQVVIISGGSTSMDRYESIRHLRPLGFLSKPFSLQRLQDALALASHS